jgi:hypothetical protein
MSPKLPTLCVLAAVLLAATACGTLGKHYGEESENPPPPSNERVITTAAILVDSVPSGAIIRMNGIKIGTGPVFARPELDESGALTVDTAISADYSTFARTRNATDVVVARYNGGDLPPRRLTLARSVDGGVVALGGSPPGN